MHGVQQRLAGLRQVGSRARVGPTFVVGATGRRPTAAQVGARSRRGTPASTGAPWSSRTLTSTSGDPAWRGDDRVEVDLDELGYVDGQPAERHHEVDQRLLVDGLAPR